MTIIIVDKKGITTDTSFCRYDLIAQSSHNKVKTFNIGNNFTKYNMYNVNVYVVGAGNTELLERLSSYIEQDLQHILDSAFITGKPALSYNIQQYWRSITRDEDFDFFVGIVYTDKSGVVKTLQAYTIGTFGMFLGAELPLVLGHSDAVKLATGALAAGATPQDAVTIALRYTGIASANLSSRTTMF